MDDATIQAMVFGVLITVVYGIHQVTAGGDGVIVASVLAAVCAVGGYTFGRGRSGS